ncbi:Hpt domain-containing protein [Vreelandella utahensis]|uniref:Hpt domain-containing protein n=1 Tax=Vreelandella halophila TaxID=86177 RepID=UPI000984D81D|nr:Hpt domain-containing protein [Halomonas utahensis]
MSEHQHIDHDALAELRDVMEDEFVILVNTFLQDADDRLEQLRAGAASEDAEEVRKMAHSFKGSCINIGAPELADRCRTAEQRGRDGDLSDIDACISAIEAELGAVRQALAHFRNQ